MSEPVRFPEYGQGGDTIGSRRQRRTFRYFVALCVLGAMTAWTLEYIKYDRSETQYRMALAHFDASARPILRKVVARDEETRDIPNTRYLAALAAVEEEDRVLPVYARAFAINPNDPTLLTLYGVELYMAGQYKDARERFREAGIEPPDNALPHYLETAAMLAAAPEIESLAAPLDVLNDAKPQTYPILFPAPMWHPSWPRDSAWYWDKQRHIVDRCLAPIFAMLKFTTPRLGAASDPNGEQIAREWLSEVRAMGVGLVGNTATPDEQLGLGRAIAGMGFERQALLLAEETDSLQAPLDSSTATERIAKLDAGITRLQQFDEKRQQSISEEQDAREVAIPLALKSLLLVFAAHILIVLLSRIAGDAKKVWGYAHSRLTVGVFLVAFVLLFGLLWGISHPGLSGVALPVLTMLWYAVLLLVGAYAFIYPAFYFPKADDVVARAATDEGESEALLPVARRARLVAHVTLTRRCAGLLLGLLLCLFAAWFVSFRIVDAYYPYQVQLLVSAHRDAEVAEIRAVQQSLR